MMCHIAVQQPVDGRSSENFQPALYCVAQASRHFIAVHAWPLPVWYNRQLGRWRLRLRPSFDSAVEPRGVIAHRIPTAAPTKKRTCMIAT
jgi:hypothetical protein